MLNTNSVFQNDFIEYKEVLAAQGVKIAAKDLEKVIAGKFLIVCLCPSTIYLTSGCNVIPRLELARGQKS
jgi:translation initiation factor IF-2